MSQTYFELVTTHANLLQANGVSSPNRGNAPSLERPPLQADAPVALLFSPHPDDECISGALPLRLAKECGWRIINLAVTLGSNPRRQSERLQELQRACQWLGFELEEIELGGLDHISAHARERNPESWEDKIEATAAVIRRYKPTMVLCPNEDDGHDAHIGTHHLVIDALTHARHACWLVQSEFWRAMRYPNVLLESNIKDTTDLVTALSYHTGEIKRNPFHLRLTSWMADNVRRGTELVNHSTGPATSHFAFGTLYRLDRFSGEYLRPHHPHYVISEKDNPRSLFTSPINEKRHTVETPEASGS